MRVASSSITLTGPVRPFLRVSRILSLSSSAFLSSLIDFTSPMVFSSCAISALVRLICWSSWFSSLETLLNQNQLPIPASTRMSPKRTICWRPNSRFLAARTGRRLILIMVLSSPLVRLAQGKPDGDGRRRGDVHHVVGVELPVVDLHALEGIEDLDRHAHPLLDHLEERGDLGGAAGEIEAGDVRVGGGGRGEGEGGVGAAPPPVRPP